MTRLAIWVVVAAAFVVFALGQETTAQTTEFTYQGSLQNSSAPASGNFDFEFLLYDAVSGGTQIGATLTKSGVAVSNGTFAVKLDFGGQFPGAVRFLEIHVRTAGGGAFVPLLPRTPISNTPYAVKSLAADSASTASFATTAGAAQSLSGPLMGNNSSAIVSASNSAGGISPNSGTPPAGVFGTATSTSGQTIGVFGNAVSTNGIGVLGNTDGTGGGGAPAVGVFGIATSTTGPANGVMGETSSSSGWAVYGNSRSTTGTSNGVVGDTNSPNGSALVGRSFGTGDILQLTSNVAGGNPKVRVLASGDLVSLANINAFNGFRTQNGAFSAGGSSATPNFSVDSNGNLIASGTITVVTMGAAGAAALCRNASNQIATCSSSARYKNNINSFTSGLSLIRQLRPVSFNWRDGGKRDMGLVAEEVNKVEPLLTTINASGQVEGVKYDRVGVVLINAVKEQQAQIEALEKQTELQQKQIEQQHAEIEQLKKKADEIDELKALVCGQRARAAMCKRRE